jgi:hypothetical protein
VDLFGTHVLNRVVAMMQRPARGLLNKYFPGTENHDTEEIYFDVKEGKRRLAPFVSPLVPGKLIDGTGYKVKSFRPAYVKVKRNRWVDDPDGATSGGYRRGADRQSRHDRESPGAYGGDRDL